MHLIVDNFASKTITKIIATTTLTVVNSRDQLIREPIQHAANLHQKANFEDVLLVVQFNVVKNPAEKGAYG